MEKPRLKSLDFAFFALIFLAANANANAGLRMAMVGGAPVQSGAFVVTAESDSKIPLSEISGDFGGGQVEFFPLGEGRFGAVVGVDYGIESKPTELKISYRLEGANKETDPEKYSFRVDVQPTVFPFETLKVAQHMIAPSAKEEKWITRDNEAIHRAYATITLHKFWDDKPILPVNGQVTSAFGTSRVYNGVKHSPHMGTDMRAPMGTKIMAPMDGLVVLARKTFLLGNMLVLDHGFGVFTIYGHFSKLLAKTGRMVKKGEVIGLSGATGRVHGPHLHWAAQINGGKVDPLLLINAMEASGLGNSSKGKRWIAGP